MTTTTKYLLIAQNYSDAAKGVGVDKTDLYGSKIVKIADNDRLDYWDKVEKLYDGKQDFLYKAAISAKKEGVNVYYNEYQGVVYFEMPFGQCSFHTCQDLPSNVIVDNDYQWNGMKNTGTILRQNYTA